MIPCGKAGLHRNSTGSLHYSAAFDPVFAESDFVYAGVHLVCLDLDFAFAQTGTNPTPFGSACPKTDTKHVQTRLVCTQTSLVSAQMKPVSVET